MHLQARPHTLEGSQQGVEADAAVQAGRDEALRAAGQASDDGRPGVQRALQHLPEKRPVACYYSPSTSARQKPFLYR